MSYTKNTWATGDTITAAKLNNMEDGIADAGYDIVIDMGDKNCDEVGVNDCTVVKFDVDAVSNKIKSATPVTGVCIRHYNYDEDVDGDTSMVMYPLFIANVYSTSAFLVFSKTITTSWSSNYVDAVFSRLHIEINLDGTLETVSGVEKGIRISA